MELTDSLLKNNLINQRTYNRSKLFYDMLDDDTLKKSMIPLPPQDIPNRMIFFWPHKKTFVYIHEYKYYVIHKYVGELIDELVSENPKVIIDELKEL